ncbi:MAG: cbb3-type cytochrome c oxidase subunit I [Verrucomicrobia bacterium]|nr:cbb3-type cytochrome c oxidase subunit I [Verrucomicrobiota bacterium]
MSITGLRNSAIVSFVVSMTILLAGGYFAQQKVPPIPAKVVSGDKVLTERDAILRGQDVYQRYGLMDHGSVWGHGALRGMDFAAETLHLIGETARAAGVTVEELRANRFNPATDTLTLLPAQAAALEQARAHWEKMFGEGNAHYGFLKDTVPTAAERRDVADFFFWTAWAAGTHRPGETYTYTNNWPPDTTVGNKASTEALVWSLISIITLLVVLGIVVYIVHRYGFFYGESQSVQAAQKLLAAPVTPSQRASALYFLVAGLLFILQIFNGGLLAHYTVHPGQFYIELVGKQYPFSWAATWHRQLAVLWIALSWMGTAVYLAPLVGRREPKGQRAMVNILLAAAVFVALGSLTGEVLGIKGMLGELWFWLGHQGWEYLELGRLWQILLFGGLLFWLVVVYRGMAPALQAKPNSETGAHTKALLWFYVFSAVFVVLFFGFGLVYGRHTHLTIADYWRWFVVHIWVESIFEFFGLAVIAMFLVTLGLVSVDSALRAAYLSAILTFLSSIPGTAHHYFWYGGPSFWLAVGGVFSSMEPIPLILLVVRAWMEYKEIHGQGREFPYRWPLFFLIASSFWNFLGAGVFGFMINLPIINYYEHATYLTSNHGHTALFGVYGMLAIALILFSWRGLVEDKHWNNSILKLSFWGLNGGLFLMFSTGLLPIGLAQVWECYDKGFWFARSAAFYDQPVIQTLGNWRAVPDTIIIVLGAAPLLWFLISTFPRLRRVGEGKRELR